jgi:hypothetical protein
VIEQGASALLASTTNVAVDEALLRTAALAGSQVIGTMIRVGHPSRSDVHEGLLT